MPVGEPRKSITSESGGLSAERYLPLQEITAFSNLSNDLSYCATSLKTDASIVSEKSAFSIIVSRAVAVINKSLSVLTGKSASIYPFALYSSYIDVNIA